MRITAGLLLALAVNALAATVTIQPPSTPAALGDTIDVGIAIEGVSDLFGWELGVSFDPTILRAAAVTEGEFLSSAGSTIFLAGPINNAAGTISFVSSALTGMIPGESGAGILAHIRFETIAYGVAPIQLNDVLLLNSALANIPADTAPGEVAVVPEPATTALCMVACAIAWGRRRLRTK